MNVLLTSAGRRSYLVKYFKESVEPLNGKVHVSNSTALCSSFKYADYTFVSPQIYNDEYIEVILEYCIKNNIALIVPLFDIDLLVLAKHKSMFKKVGVTIVVSNENVIQMCNDKWLTYNFLIENDFSAPKSYIELPKVINDLNNKNINFPLIVKPRWGMGSIGVYKVDSLEELQFFYKFIKKQINQSYLRFESNFTPENIVLIQEMIVGEEFGLDIVNNLKTDYMDTFIKRKIAMRSGETDISELIANHTELKIIGEKIAQKLKHVGNLDVDVLYDGNEYKVIEMNARFGGGYPFTHIAGVHLPKAIIDWMQGKETNYLKLNSSRHINYKSIEII